MSKIIKSQGSLIFDSETDNIQMNRQVADKVKSVTVATGSPEYNLDVSALDCNVLIVSGTLSATFGKVILGRDQIVTANNGVNLKILNNTNVNLYIWIRADHQSGPQEITVTVPIRRCCDVLIQNGYFYVNANISTA